MRVGVIGARVAGCYAGMLISRLGHEVLLLDDSMEREKPCGGGITFKALRRTKWFEECTLRSTEITRIRLYTHDRYGATLPLRHPIHLFSRQSLDASLRRSAEAAGARLRAERALGFARNGNGWAIKTPTDVIEVDYLVGADGAHSIVRASLIGKHKAADLSLALGYSLPGVSEPGTLRVSFQESGFRGYIWSFPHLDRSLVGVLRWLPEAHGADLRKRVEEFIAEHHPEAGADRTFYAARIPSLSRRSLLSQRVCGESWALLGDAAGFADSITAEGIYYALRSAELLAESFARKDPMRYESAWRSDFKAGLESAAAWRDRFYGSMILSQTFTRRALQCVRYSGAIQAQLDDLICGGLSYRSLFRSLLFRSPYILLEVIRNRKARTRQDGGQFTDTLPCN